MRVVFLGTPETAVPALEAIVDAGHDVPLVVTQPDRPMGRSKTPRPTAVKIAAAARGSRVIQPEKVRTAEFREQIGTATPDVLAVVAYGRLLPRPVLDLARFGAVNVHFSLLPKLRGAAPVQWALANGEEETGVTTFRLDDGLDTGDILMSRRVAIMPEEHAPALLGRHASDGAALLVATLAGLEAGSIHPVPQDHRGATAAPILTRTDGHWDPRWSARELAGRIRGFDPWPGVWAMLRGRRIRITAARELPGAKSSEGAGSVLAMEHDDLRLACAAGSVVALDSVQLEGGRAMRVREAVNGRLIQPGDRLERPEPAA